MKDVYYLFPLQFLNYFVITWNYRVIAQSHYFSIAASDICIAALNFTIIRRVSKADGRLGQIGYALGGALGSLLATWATTKVYGA